MGDLSDFQRTDCWRVFSWSICNQNSHFIRCIWSRSFQSYDSIYKWWEDIISWEEQWLKTKTKCKGSRMLKRTVSKKIQQLHQRWQQNSILILKTVSTKTVWWELCKSNICGTDAIVKPLITEKMVKGEKDGVMIIKPGCLMIRNM